MGERKNKVKIKVKSNNIKLANKSNQELHKFLDILYSSGYYGEIRLYFQNGNCEYLKEISRFSKKDLIERMQTKQKAH